MQIWPTWLLNSLINANPHTENLSPGEILVLGPLKEDKRCQKSKPGCHFFPLQFVLFIRGGQREGSRATYVGPTWKGARQRAACHLTPAALGVWTTGMWYIWETVSRCHTGDKLPRWAPKNGSGEEEMHSYFTHPSVNEHIRWHRSLPKG